MNLEMKIIREVNIQAEQFYDDAVSLGDHAAYALKDRHRAQITGLETIAESAFKTSDVFDYVKKQTARLKEWRQPFSEHQDTKIGFGERLKRYLEHDLAQKMTSTCSRLDIGNTTDQEKQQRRHIYLLLIRQFLRQMAAEYEYQVSLGVRQREQ